MCGADFRGEAENYPKRNAQRDGRLTGVAGGRAQRAPRFFPRRMLVKKANENWERHSLAKLLGHNPADETRVPLALPVQL